MSLVPIGGDGILFLPISVAALEAATSSSIMDAAGESSTHIGRIFLSSGPGTSKVFSSAGGKIYWEPTAITFANAGTNVRIGVQDVDPATGLEDGTFDAYDDLVGATDTITADVINTLTISIGTKTIAHGDIIAVSFEMTARGGTDVVRARNNLISAGSRYVANDSGAGPVKQSGSIPYIIIEFDDGTIGWFGDASWIHSSSNIAFNSGSTPDEYALIFTCPFKTKIDALLMCLGELDTGEDAEIILYSAPLGTPVAEHTVTIDPDIYSQPTSGFGLALFPITAFDVNAGDTLAVAYRPTAVGNRSLRRITLPNAACRAVTQLGTNWRQGTRTDQTGAFSETTNILPILGYRVSHLDDGAGGGGGSGIALSGVKVVHPGHIIVQ